MIPDMTFNAKKVFHMALVGLVLVVVLVGALFAAEAVEQNDLAQELVQRFGYSGVALLAVIAGLNALVPIPAATFVPVFLAGGLILPLIAAALTIGTIIADLIGFYLGRFGSRFVTIHYPQTYERFKNLHEHNSRWLPVFVLLYATFVPFPNEAYLIPFGILGVPLKRFILPMMLGAAIHQTALAYGVGNIFQLPF